ncbi:MAG: polyprenol monophosphomannose synthase [Patescibacteria group bacterium]
MKDLWLVIPTYNESANIIELINRLRLISFDIGILIVDDNSPDGTANLVKQKQQQDEFLHLLIRPDKLGLGSAYQLGFDYALARGALVVGQMDADLSHQPEDLPKLIDKIKNGYDVVIGSRRVSGGGIVGWGWYRRSASYSANWLARRVLGLRTKDVTAGFRLYSKLALQEIDWQRVKSNGYAWQEEMIFWAERADLKIIEVPVLFIDRTQGTSKLGGREIFSFFWTVIRLFRNKKIIRFKRMI